MARAGAGAGAVAFFDRLAAMEIFRGDGSGDENAVDGGIVSASPSRGGYSPIRA